MFVFAMLGSIESSFSSIATTFTNSATNQDEALILTKAYPAGIPVEMRAIFTSKSPTWSPVEVPRPSPQEKSRRSRKVPTTATTTSREVPTTNSSSKKLYHQRTRQSSVSKSPTYSPENYPSLTVTGLAIPYPAAQESPKLISNPTKSHETSTTTQRTTSTSAHKSQTDEIHNLLVNMPSAAPKGSSVSSGSSEMPVSTATHTPDWSGSKAPTTTQRKTPSLASKSPSYTPSNIPAIEEYHVTQPEKERYQLINSKNHSWTSPEQNMMERSSTIKSPSLTLVQTQSLFNRK